MKWADLGFSRGGVWINKFSNILLAFFGRPNCFSGHSQNTIKTQFLQNFVAPQLNTSERIFWALFGKFDQKIAVFGARSPSSLAENREGFESLKRRRRPPRSKFDSLDMSATTWLR